MGHETIRLEVSDVAWLDAGEEPRQPTLTVWATEEVGTLRERFARNAGTSLTPDDVDVTFRFKDPSDASGARGVLAIADRETGAFHLEVDANGTDLLRFVAAARRYVERSDDATRYRIRVFVDDEPVTDMEKRTLLVYSVRGELLRQHSLIPSGVEI